LPEKSYWLDGILISQLTVSNHEKADTPASETYNIPYAIRPGGFKSLNKTFITKTLKYIQINQQSIKFISDRNIHRTQVK